MLEPCQWSLSFNRDFFGLQRKSKLQVWNVLEKQFQIGL